MPSMASSTGAPAAAAAAAAQPAPTTAAASAHRKPRRASRTRQARPTPRTATPALLIIVLLGAAFAVSVLAVLIGPELYAFYNSKQHQRSAPHSFAAFLFLRKQERAAARAALNYGHSAPLLRLRTRIFLSPWAQQIRKQWSTSILASLPPALSIPGLLDILDEQQQQRLQKRTIADHVHLLYASPHTHLPWPLALLPGLFRLAAALSLMPIALIGVADFAGYAVFRTLGLQRRRVRIKRSTPPSAKSTGSLGPKPQNIAPIRQGTDRQQGQTRSDADQNGSRPRHVADRGGPSPLPFPRPPGSGPVSPQPGEAGGAPLLTPGAYDAEVLLRHRARSRSASRTESESAEAEWARTGGSFARVGAVREAALRAKKEAEAQGVPPLTLPSLGGAGMTSSGLPSPAEPINGTSGYIEAGVAIAAAAARAGARGGAGSVANSPGGGIHATLASPPASPRTRFFQLHIPGAIGPDGVLGMHDLTDFEDSGAESGTSSPVHGFSRASSISSAHGAAIAQQLGNVPTTIRLRSHRPRIGGFTPLATPAELEGVPQPQRGGSGRSSYASGAVASAHTSDGDSEDAHEGSEGELARSIAQAGRAALAHSGSSSSAGSSSVAAPRKHGQLGAHAAGTRVRGSYKRTTTGEQSDADEDGDEGRARRPLHSSSSARKVLLPDANLLQRTLRTLAGVAKSALTPGPMDPDVARLTGAAAAEEEEEDEDDGHGSERFGGQEKVGATAIGPGTDGAGSNLLGLHDTAGGGGEDAWRSRESSSSGGGGGGRRQRRVSLFGDEEINSTYSGAGLGGLRSADTEV